MFVCSRHGYETVHLSTHDKQSFYEHLGYTLSTPVSAETKVSRLFHNSQVSAVVIMVMMETTFFTVAIFF